MKLYSIETGNFKLDGGAMFGVVPKSIWNKLNPADENNMCNWAMRCLLVEDRDRLLLIDNGLGDKQDAKFFSHYYLNGDDSLDKSLHRHGFSREDITDVFLTHLHFDHCGGSVRRKEDGNGFETCFKNAVYWSNKKHWEWATHPNAREKASFLKENILPIEESGQLRFADENTEILSNMRIRVVNGHTEGMMLPQIKYKDSTLVFMADLIPSAAHIPLAYVMAYDTRPLLTLDEKSAFLAEAARENYVLFYEHDPLNTCSRVLATEKGYRASEPLLLEDL